jgi:hypothetical protein
MTANDWHSLTEFEPLTGVAALLRDARDEMPGIDDFLLGWLANYAGVEETAKAIAAYRAALKSGALS